MDRQIYNTIAWDCSIARTVNTSCRKTVTGLPFSTKPSETERNPTKPSDYYRQMCYKNVSNSNISEGPSGGSRAAAAVADGCRKVV